MAKEFSIDSIRIDGYNSGPQNVDTTPPAVAIFNKGATTVKEIQQGCDARREHTRFISNLPSPPKQSPNS
jgi:hypothetical protein